MKITEDLSEKEIERRKKLSAMFEERRRAGYARYLKKKHKEMERRKKREKKLKEKEKEKKRLARLKEKEKLKLQKKKKIGRPKKTGPKVNYYQRYKKRKKIPGVSGPPKMPPFIYKIISCRNGTQNKFIGRYRTIEEAYDAFEELKRNDEKVIFPSSFTGCEKLENSIDEYLLIEKSDGENPMLRNEYGKLVEQKLNTDGWKVLDKFRYKREETFWVYGYDKKKDRKTFQWIYEELVLSNIENPYTYKRVLIYKNKIIIKNDDGSLDLIFCKHMSDSVRFYNKLEEWVKKDKIKQIVFIGDYGIKSERKKKLEDELMELTGWPRRKIQMKGTSYFLTK